jgi:hypothetical protein
LLFTEFSLNETYLNKGIPPLFIEICQIIISIIISLVALVLMNKCIRYDERLFTIYYEIKNTNTLEFFIETLITQIKRNFIVFTVIQVICMIFFWYYISLFCIVYKSTEFIWVRGATICFVLVVVFDFLLCFVTFLFRYVGLVKKKRSVFNIGLFLYKCL